MVVGGGSGGPADAVIPGTDRIVGGAEEEEAEGRWWESLGLERESRLREEQR